MREFPYLEVTARQLNLRRPRSGVGINDAPYITTPTVEGKPLWCPFYRVWANMIDRGYSLTVKKRQPYYADARVCSEWHHFMSFRDWMELQDWRGKALDKDILVPGNLEYAPDKCAFVLPATNNLITRDHSRGMPRGVDKNMGRYRAICGGKLLGRYDTPEEAHRAWRSGKAKAVIEASLREKDPRIPPALLRIAAELLRETTDTTQ